MNVSFLTLITVDCEAFSVTQFFNISLEEILLSFNRFPKEEATQPMPLTMKHLSRFFVSLHKGHLYFSFGRGRMSLGLNEEEEEEEEEEEQNKRNNIKVIFLETQRSPGALNMLQGEDGELRKG